MVARSLALASELAHVAPPIAAVASRAPLPRSDAAPASPASTPAPASSSGSLDQEVTPTR